MPEAVDTVVYAPDDGWRYHPKHVEQFPDKIKCVTLHLIGYILEMQFVFTNTSLEGQSTYNKIVFFLYDV